MTVDRDRGFAVVEARAVYFRLPQTCSPIHVDKCSLKTRWTSTRLLIDLAAELEEQSRSDDLVKQR